VLDLVTMSEGCQDDHQSCRGCPHHSVNLWKSIDLVSKSGVLGQISFIYNISINRMYRIIGTGLIIIYNIDLGLVGYNQGRLSIFDIIVL